MLEILQAFQINFSRKDTCLRFLSNRQNGMLNEPLFGLFEVLYEVLLKRGRRSSISKCRLEIWTKSLVSIFKRKPKAWNFRSCFSYDSFLRGFREIALSKLLLIKSLCQLQSDHCWIKIAWSDFKNTCCGGVRCLSSISFLWPLTNYSHIMWSWLRILKIF